MKRFSRRPPKWQPPQLARPPRPRARRVSWRRNVRRREKWSKWKVLHDGFTTRRFSARRRPGAETERQCFALVSRSIKTEGDRLLRAWETRRLRQARRLRRGDRVRVACPDGPLIGRFEHFVRSYRAVCTLDGGERRTVNLNQITPVKGKGGPK